MMVYALVDDALSPDCALGIELSREAACIVGGANRNSAYQQFQTLGGKGSWLW
jgi:hypothetical protein